MEPTTSQTIQPSTKTISAADIEQRIATLEAKIDKVFISAERTRKYILWTGIVTLALFILPLIGLVFAIPSFMSEYTQINTLGL